MLALALLLVTVLFDTRFAGQLRDTCLLLQASLRPSLAGAVSKLFARSAIGPAWSATMSRDGAEARVVVTLLGMRLGEDRGQRVSSGAVPSRVCASLPSTASEYDVMFDASLTPPHESMSLEECETIACALTAPILRANMLLSVVAGGRSSLLFVPLLRDILVRAIMEPGPWSRRLGECAVAEVPVAPDSMGTEFGAIASALTLSADGVLQPLIELASEVHGLAVGIVGPIPDSLLSVTSFLARLLGVVGDYAVDFAGGHTELVERVRRMGEHFCLLFVQWLQRSDTLVHAQHMLRLHCALVTSAVNVVASNASACARVLVSFAHVVAWHQHVDGVDEHELHECFGRYAACVGAVADWLANEVDTVARDGCLNAAVEAALGGGGNGYGLVWCRDGCGVFRRSDETVLSVYMGSVVRARTVTQVVPSDVTTAPDFGEYFEDRPKFVAGLRPCGSGVRIMSAFTRDGCEHTIAAVSTRSPGEVIGTSLWWCGREWVRPDEPACVDTLVALRRSGVHTAGNVWWHSSGDILFCGCGTKGCTAWRLARLCPDGVLIVFRALCSFGTSAAADAHMQSDVVYVSCTLRQLHLPPVLRDRKGRLAASRHVYSGDDFACGVVCDHSDGDRVRLVIRGLTPARRFVPLRLLRGHVPDALLRATRFFVDSCGSIVGECCDGSRVRLCDVGSGMSYVTAACSYPECSVPLCAPVLLDVRDSTHPVIRAALSIEDAAEILAWGQCSSEGGVESVVFVELPRLGLRFQRRDSDGQYYCNEASTMYVRIKPAVGASSLLLGLPGLWLEDANGARAVLLACHDIVPPTTGSVDCEAAWGLEFDRSSPVWRKETSSRVFIYSVHPSGAMLLPPSLSAALYLFVLLLATREYERAATLIRAHISDTAVTEEVAAICALIKHSEHDATVDACACRLLAYVSCSAFSGCAFVVPVVNDIVRYIRSSRAARADCRLTRDEEIVVLESGLATQRPRIHSYCRAIVVDELSEHGFEFMLMSARLKFLTVESKSAAYCMRDVACHAGGGWKRLQQCAPEFLAAVVDAYTKDGTPLWNDTLVYDRRDSATVADIVSLFDALCAAPVHSGFQHIYDLAVGAVRVATWEPVQAQHWAQLLAMTVYIQSQGQQWAPFWPAMSFHLLAVLTCVTPGPELEKFPPFPTPIGTVGRLLAKPLQQRDAWVSRVVTTLARVAAAPSNRARACAISPPTPLWSWGDDLGAEPAPFVLKFDVDVAILAHTFPSEALRLRELCERPLQELASLWCLETSAVRVDTSREFPFDVRGIAAGVGSLASSTLHRLEADWTIAAARDAVHGHAHACSPSLGVLLDHTQPLLCVPGLASSIAVVNAMIARAETLLNEDEALCEASCADAGMAAGDPTELLRRLAGHVRSRALETQWSALLFNDPTVVPSVLPGSLTALLSSCRIALARLCVNELRVLSDALHAALTCAVVAGDSGRATIEYVLCGLRGSLVSGDDVALVSQLRGAVIEHHAMWSARCPRGTPPSRLIERALWCALADGDSWVNLSMLEWHDDAVMRLVHRGWLRAVAEAAEVPAIDSLRRVELGLSVPVSVQRVTDLIHVRRCFVRQTDFGFVMDARLLVMEAMCGFYLRPRQYEMFNSFLECGLRGDGTVQQCLMGTGRQELVCRGTAESDVAHVVLNHKHMSYLKQQNK